MNKLPFSLTIFVIKLILGNKVFLPTLSPFIFANLIDLDSYEGENLLKNSFLKENYFFLKENFEKQIWYSYCGVASAAIVLNILSDSSDIFVQPKNILETSSKGEKQIISPWEVISGMTLEQLKHLFESYRLNVEVYYAEDLSLEIFRNVVVTNISQPKKFVIVNYLRLSLGQVGAGHFSPLGGYNQSTDRFLIMDVANQRSSVWVTAETLYHAIKTNDFWTGKSRGFVTVSA